MSFKANVYKKEMFSKPGTHGFPFMKVLSGVVYSTCLFETGKVISGGLR